MLCFKSKDRGPTVGIGAKEEVAKTFVPKITHVAIVVGHWEYNTGMETYRDVEEWHYCSAVARHIYVNAHKISPTGEMKINTFNRPSLDYDASMKKLANEVAGWCGEDNIKTTLVIELHLNASGIPEARGCEILLQDGDDRSAKVCKLLIQDWAQLYKIKLRNSYKKIKGIKPTVYDWRKKTAGGGFNHYMRKKGFLNGLFEPFFGDFENEETRRFCQDDNGPRFMADFFIGFLQNLNARLEKIDLEADAQQSV